ncbi:hypothetical protein AB0P36_35890 [Streptomyces flavidovirens]|uniref:hypothetical protein n=1 Tax=Streptomyces flavidovirens TaxID=67298 RepID=UPI0034369E45
MRAHDCLPRRLRRSSPADPADAAAGPRLLLSYVATLPLSSSEARLLAVVIAIRLRTARHRQDHGTGPAVPELTDPTQAVHTLRGLAWTIPDLLLDGPAEAPVAVTVPAPAAKDQPLPFGGAMRSRVSGWTTRTLAAKPLRKTAPAVRLGALFLATHSSPKLCGTLPADLPEACRATLPELLEKTFLAELSGEQYRLDPGLRHLAGILSGPANAALLPEQPQLVL